MRSVLLAKFACEGDATGVFSADGLVVFLSRSGFLFSSVQTGVLHGIGGGADDEFGFVAGCKWSGLELAR